MVSFESADMGMSRSALLSILLHALVFMVIFLVSWWRPFTPSDLVFDQVEIIDSDAFDALVDQAQSGSEGEDAQDAPAQAQTETPAPEEVAPSEAPTETEAEPTPPPAPLAPPEPAPQPDDLPEPVFQPQDTQPQEQLTPQPLPQADEADRTGLADPESEGREQVDQITTLTAPPPRDATELRQIAEEAQDDPRLDRQEEITVADGEREEEQVEAQAEQNRDATTSIEPEASRDAPLSAAPEVALAPPSRPSNHSNIADQIESNQAAAEVASDTQSTDAPAVNGAEAAQNNAGAAEAAVDGASLDTEIDELLESVLEEQTGNQSSGRGITPEEQASITRYIHEQWVKSTIIDKDNYERLVVSVGFHTDARGNLIGDVDLILPRNPSNDQLVAFQAARRAVINSMPLPMPPDIDPQGVIWTITFDPAPNRGGF